jgi:hypothetical protein
VVQPRQTRDMAGIPSVYYSLARMPCTSALPAKLRQRRSGRGYDPITFNPEEINKQINKY